MERILTYEYLSYEQGFFDGKNDIILQFTSSIEETEYDEEYEDDLDEVSDDWYDKGYEDAKNYYFDQLFKDKNIDDLIFDGEEKVDEFYTERVVEFNTSKNEEMPIGVFKLKR